MNLAILLVDPDERSYAMMQEKLISDEEITFQAHHCKDLPETIRFLEDTPVDVLLLYRQDSGLSPIAAIRELRQRHPALPLLICSDTAPPTAEISALLREGAQDYILRPECTPHLLRKTILFALDRMQFQRQEQEKEVRFRAVVDQGQTAIAVLRDTSISMLNPAAGQILGVEDSSTLIDQNFLDFVAAEDQSIVQVWLASRLKADAQNLSIEIHLTTPGQEQRAVELSGNVLELEGQQWIQLNLRDITAFKKEQALREMSEASYKELFDLSSDYMFILDQHGTFLDVNLAVIEGYGYEPKEVIGQNPTLLAAPNLNDMDQIMSSIKKVWEGTPQNFDFWAIRKNLEVFPKEVSMRKGRYFEQDVIIAAGREISERLTFQDQLREREERIRILVEQASDGMVVTSAEGQIQDINEKASLIFGYSREQLIGMHITQLISPESREQTPIRFEELLAGKTVLQEREIIKQDQSRIYVEISAKLLSDGRLQAIARDITDRKKAELELKESRNFISGITEAVPDIIFTYDLDQQQFTYFNRSIAGDLGYSAEEERAMNGQFFHNLIHPDDREERFSFQEKLEANPGKPFEMNFRLRDASGTYRWFLGRDQAHRYHEDGSIAEVLGTLRNITNIKIAEENLRQAKEKAEIAAKAKQDFLSNMSHEMRTPMNAILGYTELLLEEDPTEEQDGHLRVLKSSAKHLLVLIDDILDYAKIESGKLELRESDFQVKDVVQNLRKTFEADFERKDLDLVIEVDKDIPGPLIGDSVRLSQILYNLVGNALKFTEKGTVTVKAVLKNLDNDMAAVAFSVVDTGIGIPKNKLQFIFERFSQIRGKAQVQQKGSGLGLSITRGLLMLQNSDIRVSSKTGEGSTFSFELHFPLATSAPKVEQQTAGQQASNGLSEVRLLFVEDNQVNRMIAGRFLEKWHVQTDFAVNGKEAVEMVEREVYDLILMDLQMPVMDGFEATKIIRAMNDPQKANTPIVALSADAMESTRKQAMQMGLNDYVTKPFSPDHLKATIRQHVRN